MRTAILLISPLVFLVACGGGSGGGTPPGPLDVNLTATGAIPLSFSALSQANLRFVNQDMADHQIVGSSNCLELSTRRLTPGTNTTIMLGVGPKSCTFSDSVSSAAAFQGTINVLPPNTGY
jgi:hypothetical protein